jgi:hypothetical protein
MRWTSWRDCEERSIGPDGYRLTSERITPLPACPAPQLFWNRLDAGEGVAWIVEPQTPIPAPRPSKPSHLISSNVTKTAASECDLWNGASLAMISRPGYLAPFSSLL